MKRNTLKRLLTTGIAILTTLSILLTVYMGIVWLNIPGISALRDLWIETAMTTEEHQWLATGFFPRWLVDSVMAQQVRPGEIYVPVPSPTDSNITPAPTPTPIPDILGQKKLTVGKNDDKGNKVLINDIEEGIVILEVKGSSYKGHLVLIDDPSRVFLGTTDRKNVWGQVVCDMMKDYNAVVGINASGFEDPDGHGKGGKVNGLCFSQGESWGTYYSPYASICITKDNKLLVGNFSDWEKYNVRDGAQFYPPLISDGKVLIGRGYGLQPRTIIAQAENGVMMFLVIDGRAIHSAGATYKQCVEILLEYGAVNAAACDGGSSSVLGYNGKVLNIPSTPMKDTGRYLPNAFMVRSKAV
jgi:exopolysaccharide biosynthesis protein